MFIKKNFNVFDLFKFSGHHLIWLLPLIGGVALLQRIEFLSWTMIPWQPVAVIGTAVAFYLGFKNNQSYDRLWEARKIWGSIVNSSRAWGIYVKGFVSNHFADEKISEHEVKKIKERLIYRHIAWLYVLRSQLLEPTPWEHISQNGLVAKFARKRRERHGIGLLKNQYTEDELHKFLSSIECEDIKRVKNRATHIIDQQSEDLRILREQNLIDDFRHMELQKMLYDLFVHQGKCERIKKFPLPRQYGSMSFILVGIFIAILPFGLVPLFNSMGPIASWWGVPITILVAWVYLVMELIGDYSENPFEGTANDIPMLSLCRTIEIDLLDMLGEDNIPKPIEAQNNVLM